MLTMARTWVTTKQIAERFDLEERTVQRIIKAMGEFLPVERDPLGGGIRLIQGFEMKVPLPTNLLELAALRIAQDQMRTAAEGSVIGEAFEQLASRALKDLKGVQRAICDRFVRMYRAAPNDAPGTATPISQMIHKAIDEHRALFLEYVSPNEQRPKGRDVEPLAVWVTAQRSYLVARDSAKNAIRTFALDRIRGVSVTSRLFPPHSDFDVAAYFQRSISAFVGTEPIAIVLRLDPEATRRLGKKRPAKTARLVNRPDGSSDLHWELALSDELVAWMVSLGAGVSVIAPEQAVNFVRDAFRLRANAQPKKRRESKARKQPKRPTSLPGPLVRSANHGKRT